jgi:hypothetical protein
MTEPGRPRRAAPGPATALDSRPFYGESQVGYRSGLFGTPGTANP